MGVDGFLRQLREAVDKTHLQQFAGQTLVVDALSWLHKACYGCAFELSTGRTTDKYVQYMLRKVDMMRGCGVAKVVLVFDGQRLPLKSSTQERRQCYKEENRKRALQSMDACKRLQGADRQDEVNRAFQLFQRSVSITPEIISTVMNALRAARVPFVVAPFEADAQMVWMCKEGLAAGIVTEDSDVVVYCLAANVSCPVLVKLEDNGSAQAVSRSILYNNSAKATSGLLKKIHFFTSGDKETTRMFVQVCVLAGCDFIDSLPNVGFSTAVKHIFNFRGAPAHLRVQRLVNKLSSSGTKVPSDFIQQFLKAETIFFHHIIFNPNKHNCEFLINEGHINCFSDILQRANESLGITSTEGEVDLASTTLEGLYAVVTSTKSFLGQVRSREIIEQIYKGEMCARTLRCLSESPMSSQNWESESFQGGRTSFNAPRSVKDSPDGDEFEQGFHTVVRQREVSQPSPVMTAEQLEKKMRSQVNERAASLQGLMSTYKTRSTEVATSATNEAPWLTSATQSCKSEQQNGSNSNLTADTPSGHLLTSTSTVVKATKVTATSMKDLIAKHSQSVQTLTSPVVHESTQKIVPQSAPGSRKRLRLTAKPTANSTRKAQTLGRKATLGNGKKTLFDFFQKQT